MDFTFAQGRKFGKREFVVVKNDQVLQHVTTYKCNACKEFFPEEQMHLNADQWMSCKPCWDS